MTRTTEHVDLFTGAPGAVESVPAVMIPPAPTSAPAPFTPEAPEPFEAPQGADQFAPDFGNDIAPIDPKLRAQFLAKYVPIFIDDLIEAGVSREEAIWATSWFGDWFDHPIPDSAPRSHGYRINYALFAAEDRDHLDAFATQAQQRGWSDEYLDAALSEYLDFSEWVREQFTPTPARSAPSQEAPQQPQIDLDDPEQLQRLMTDVAINHPQERAQLLASLLPEVERAALALGVKHGAIRTAVAWLEQSALRPASTERPAHGYWGVDIRSLPAMDQPWLIPFLNAMHRAGVSAEDVSKLITAYGHVTAKRLRDAQARQAQAQHHAALEEQLAARTPEQIAQQDVKDRARVETQMRTEWGDEYNLNIALINKYLDNLPAEKRLLLETAQRPDGGLWLNTAEALRDLARRARSSGMSRHEIEALMFYRRGDYDRNPVAQAHLRDYIRGTATGPAPKRAMSVDAEIASIENIMRTDRRRYNRDESMQARLRDLYAVRDH